MDELETLVDRFGHVQARYEELDGYALDARAREILAGLGFSDAMQDGDVGALSGGWKMRVALARILLMRPDAMLLDEPTNHLDMRAKDVLLDAIAAFSGTVIFVSHDRYFIDRLATRVIEIENGFVTSYEGNYEDYLRRTEAEVILIDRTNHHLKALVRGSAADGEEPKDDE